MDVEEHDLRSSNEVLSPFNEMKNENSSGFVDGPVIETVLVVKTEEAACNSRENNNKDLKLMDCELGSNKAVAEGLGIEMGGSGEVSDQVEQRTNENSTNSAAVGAVVETHVVINQAEAPFVIEDNRVLNAKVEGLGLSKVSVEQSKRKMIEAEKHSCVIDINCGSAKSWDEKWDGERVCRICHLASDQSPDRRTATTSTTDLIHLGCGCKDDLGIAHYQCAEAWFKLKGNRMCEICGESAKNITGVGDIRFMEEWNESTYGHSSSHTSDRGGCWRGQPFCNFLMACLVIAFVLPWFFRVNMF